MLWDSHNWTIRRLMEVNYSELQWITVNSLIGFVLTCQLFRWKEMSSGRDASMAEQTMSNSIINWFVLVELVWMRWASDLQVCVRLESILGDAFSEWRTMTVEVMKCQSFNASPTDAVEMNWMSAYDLIIVAKPCKLKNNNHVLDCFSFAFWRREWVISMRFSSNSIVRFNRSKSILIPFCCSLPCPSAFAHFTKCINIVISFWFPSSLHLRNGGELDRYWILRRMSSGWEIIFERNFLVFFSHVFWRQ